MSRETSEPSDLIWAVFFLLVGAAIIVSHTSDMPAALLWVGYAAWALAVAGFVSWWTLR